jgi:hypothetical protein
MASEVRGLNDQAYVDFRAKMASDSGEKGSFGFHFQIQFL